MNTVKKESMLALLFLDALKADDVNRHAEDCRQKRPMDDVLPGIMATQGDRQTQQRDQGKLDEDWT